MLKAVFWFVAGSAIATVFFGGMLFAFGQTSQVDWVVARALDNIIAGKELLDGKLGPVKIPVLIVWGKQDGLTPLSVGQAMQREMPQSRLEVFDDCAHMTPLECSGRVVPEVARFLDSDPPEPAGTQEIAAPRER